MKLMLLLAFALLVALRCQRRRGAPPTTRAQKWVLASTTLAAVALGAVIAFGGYV